MAEEYFSANIRSASASLDFSSDDKLKDELKHEMRWLDVNVNINWTLAHYKSAVRYLQRDPEDIAATGGTNWQKYLPPRFQKRIFFPELWTEQELEDWGKTWVKKEIFGINS
jgi:tryptophan 2,3-dioxygenase